VCEEQAERAKERESESGRKKRRKRERERNLSISITTFLFFPYSATNLLLTSDGPVYTEHVKGSVDCILNNNRVPIDCNG
jgi:hypothetical protein